MQIYNEIVMVDIDKIKPYFKNPRINDKTVDKLVNAIKKVGFNVPIVIDKNNVVVKGHARLKALRKLNVKQVPCIISEADEETNRLDRLADNKLNELSMWDQELLNFELNMIDLNVEDFGFEKLKLDAISLNDIKFKDNTEGNKDNEEKYLMVKCEKCGNEFYISTRELQDRMREK